MRSSNYYTNLFTRNFFPNSFSISGENRCHRLNDQDEEKKIRSIEALKQGYRTRKCGFVGLIQVSNGNPFDCYPKSTAMDRLISIDQTNDLKRSTCSWTQTSFAYIALHFDYDRNKICMFFFSSRVIVFCKNSNYHTGLKKSWTFWLRSAHSLSSLSTALFMGSTREHFEMPLFHKTKWDNLTIATQINGLSCILCGCCHIDNNAKLWNKNEECFTMENKRREKHRVYLITHALKQ